MSKKGEKEKEEEEGDSREILLGFKNNNQINTPPFFFHQNRGNCFLKDNMLQNSFQAYLEHHQVPMCLIEKQVDGGTWHINLLCTK